MGIEDIIADVEVLPQPRLPGGAMAETVADPITAGLRVVVVVDQQALAVVRQHGKGVGAAPGARAGQQRFEQDERERRDCQRLQGRARDAHRGFRPGAGVAPEDQEGRDRHHRGGAGPPVGVRQGSGTANSSAAPQPFVVTPDPFGEFWRDRISIDRDEGIGRFAAADFLGDPVAQLADRVGHEPLHLGPVGHLRVPLEVFAGTAYAVTNPRRLGPQRGVFEQLLHVSHAVGPLAESLAGDRPSRPVRIASQAVKHPIDARPPAFSARIPPGPPCEFGRGEPSSWGVLEPRSDPGVCRLPWP